MPGGPQPAEEALTLLAHGCQPSGGLWTPSEALALARCSSWALAIRTASASTPTRLCTQPGTQPPLFSTRAQHRILHTAHWGRPCRRRGLAPTARGHFHQL